MKCYFPLTYDPILKQLDARGGLKIPCGRCHACLRNRAFEWSLRFQHEFRTSACGYFSTLTYSPENLPIDGQLRYSDIQLFHKRLRKRFGSFRFFLCGEYGPKTLRPHYHSAYFFSRPIQDFECDTSWQMGFTQVRQIENDDGAGAYIAQYVVKKWKTERDNASKFSVLPFLRQSQGIGREFAIAHAADILSRGYVYAGKFKKPIPRYYLKLFEDKFPLEYRAFKSRRRCEIMSRLTDKEFFDNLTVEDMDIFYMQNKKRFFSDGTEFK